MSFSGKMKKQALQRKRAAKREAAAEEEAAERAAPRAALGGAPAPRNKLRTLLQREDDARVQAGRADATRPLELEEAAQRGLLPEWPSSLQPSVSMPLRPAWSYEDTPGALEARETAAFAAWEAELAAAHPALARYERNIEVWRQLWRTLEVSDALLLIVDSRTPLLSFPQPLYDEASRRGLPCVCLLNKADLLPPAVAEAWAAHLRLRFPRLAAVVHFTADPGAPPKGYKGVRRRGFQRWRSGGEAVRRGVRALLETVKALPVARAGGETTFGAFWASRPGDEASDADESGGEEGDEEAVPVALAPTLVEELASGVASSRSLLPYVTLGVVGEPNMGKSAVINRLFRAPVVKASPTPGCTKHLQTLFLCPNVRLADCPGLIFPKTGVDAGAQLLCGNLPIAQAREPFSTVRYLAEAGVHPPLQQAYGLSLADVAEHSSMAEGQWSPYALCEALARKRSFLTRGGAPDVHRAANRILRDALAGKNIRLAFVPPGSAPLPWPPAEADEGEEASGAVHDDEEDEEEEDEGEAAVREEEAYVKAAAGASRNPFDALGEDEQLDEVDEDE